MLGARTCSELQSRVADEPCASACRSDGVRLLPRRYRQCAHASRSSTLLSFPVLFLALTIGYARPERIPTPSSPSASPSRRFWRGLYARRGAPRHADAGMSKQRVRREQPTSISSFGMWRPTSWRRSSSKPRSASRSRFSLRRVFLFSTSVAQRGIVLGVDDPGVARLSRCRAVDRTRPRRRRRCRTCSGPTSSATFFATFSIRGEVRRNGQMSRQSSELLSRSQADARRPLDDGREAGPIQDRWGNDPSPWTASRFRSTRVRLSLGESGPENRLALSRSCASSNSRRANILRHARQFAPRRGEPVDLARLPRRASCASSAADQIGMIFQEPMTSLDPVFTIERRFVDRLRRIGA